MPQFIYQPGVPALTAQGLPNSVPTIDMPTLIPGQTTDADARRDQEFIPYNPALVEARIVPSGTKRYVKPVGPAFPNTWKTILGAVKTGLIGTGNQNAATGNVQATAGAGAGVDNSAASSGSSGGTSRTTNGGITAQNSK